MAICLEKVSESNGSMAAQAPVSKDSADQVASRDLSVEQATMHHRPPTQPMQARDGAVGKSCSTANWSPQTSNWRIEITDTISCQDKNG